MFSNVLKELREEKKLTQERLAREFNMSRNTIASWEAKKREPPIETIVKIADYFSVSLDYLCGRTADPSRAVTEYQPAAELLPRERRLLTDFRQLNDGIQNRVLGYVSALKEEFKGEQKHG